MKTFPIYKLLKFVFSKKATKIDEIFNVDLTVLCSKCQIDGEDFVKFCGLLRKHKLYESEIFGIYCKAYGTQTEKQFVYLLQIMVFIKREIRHI